MSGSGRQAAPRSLPASAQFDFVYGRFNLSNKYAVPYFATTMTMREAAESLQLVGDLPGNERLAWKIDELYQRDIDWGRVEREIVPYLSGSDAPQFFNSLTVAFVPIRENEVKESFSGEGWTPPPLDGKFAKTLQVGPVSVGYFEDWTNHDDQGARVGQVRWNTKQVFSVAIDGQHRLAALKLLADGFDEKADRTQVPVLLLVLDERLGFRAPSDRKLVELMRGLFIDLNKHARSVSRPRQILLDDKDPHSLCVRALVGEQIIDSMDERKKGRLPLSLVDWHGEKAKIEKGPYVATILGLDWIVEKTLGSKPIKDYAAYGAVKRQLRAISLSLGLDFHKPGSPTFQRFKEIEDAAVEPFSYTGYWSHSGSDGELGRIVEAFKETWAEGLVTLLTEFSPYSELVAEREKVPPSSADFVNWYYLRERMEAGEKAGQEYTNFVNRLKNRPAKDKPVQKAVLEARLANLERIKGDSLAFKVAFQRSLVSAFLDFVDIDGGDLPEVDFGDEEDAENGDESEVSGAEGGGGGGNGGSNVAKRAKQFVAALNEVVEAAPVFLDVRGKYSKRDDFIWDGSLFDRGAQAIDFTLGASRRGRDVVFMAAALWLCKEQKDAAIKNGFDAFWDGISESDVGVHQKLYRCVKKRFADKGGAGGRIVSERGEYSPDDALEEARIRLRWLWETLELPTGKKKR